MRFEVAYIKYNLPNLDSFALSKPYFNMEFPRLHCGVVVEKNTMDNGYKGTESSTALHSVTLLGVIFILDL